MNLVIARFSGPPRADRRDALRRYPGFIQGDGRSGLGGYQRVREKYLACCLMILVGLLAEFSGSSFAQAQSPCRCGAGCKAEQGGFCGCGCSSATVNTALAVEQEFLPPDTAPQMASAGCSGGTAGGFPCQGVNLSSNLSLAAMGGGSANGGNDIWGWTSPVTNIDYALVGRTDGTRIVDLSNPASPIYLGNIPRTAGTSITAWRDIKTYNNRAYIVADFGANEGHGMQVFDLSVLDTASRISPTTFSPTTTYFGVGKTHNLAINEATGFAFLAGSNTFGGGLHAVNIQNPTPVFAGGYSGDGYSHDTQVVVYNGPDTAYAGREISFSSNEDTLTIVDFTNKSSPVEVSRTSYYGASYSHQGWLTADQHYFLMNDELDELNRGDVDLTRTHIWDVSDINAPKYLGFEPLRTGSTDHNLYTVGGLVYEANYTSGLRILDTSDIRNGDLYEVGWFDIVPSNNDPGFDGAWSVYHFAGSGVTVVNGINQGLFVLDTSGIVAGAPTMGVMNGSFEQLEHGQVAATLPANYRLYMPFGARHLFGTDFTYDMDVAGWISPVTNGGLWHITSADVPAGAPNGTNVLFLRANPEPVTVRQVLANVLLSNTIYTLDVMVSQSILHAQNAGYNVGLYAGDTLLAQLLDTDSGAPSITPGSFKNLHLLVNSQDFISLLGKPLEIRLSTRRIGDGVVDWITLFDDVKLTVTSLQMEVIPEPASLGMILSGGLLLAGRSRRRRQRVERGYG